MNDKQKEIFEQSKDLIVKHKLLFVKDIVDFLPITRKTFYNYFPDGSEELAEISKLLDINKVSIKANLRGKWYNSDNATLQLALYRLVADSEEHRMLNQHYVDHTTNGDKITTVNIIEPKDE